MRALTVLVVILTALLVPLFSMETPSNVYTYYFYMPTSGGRLVVFGVSQASLKLYKLNAEYMLINETSVSRYGRLEFNVEKGCYKLVSSSRILAIIYLTSENSWLTTLYTSVEGGYVGREFVLPFSPGDVAVHAFEDSEVTLYSGDGKKITSFKLWQNETKPVSLSTEVVRIVSTGRIAVGQHQEGGMMFMVDATGRFRGRNLFGAQHRSQGVLAAIAYQPCLVKAHIATSPGQVAEHRFTEDEVADMKLWEHRFEKDVFYWVESTGDITVLVGEGARGNTAGDLSGVAIAGLAPRDNIRVYAPTAMVLIPLGTGSAQVNGETQPVYEGQPIIYPRGSYEVVTEVPLIVEVLGAGVSSLADPSAYWYADGECLLSDKDIVYYGPPKPGSKPKESGFPVNMVTGVTGAAALVAILAVLLFKRRRPGKA